MKPWALLPLLSLASGCLYLDGINEAPTITLDDAITTTFKGASLTLLPRVSDPDDDAGSLLLTDTVEARDDLPLADCDYSVALNGRSLTVTFYRTGIFRVGVTATDPRGASAVAYEMLTITDAPPMFSGGATITQTTARDACDLNPAGDVVTLGLHGTVTDDDAGAVKPVGVCSPHDKLAYTWRISDQPSGTMPVLTRFDGSACEPRTATSGPTLDVPDTNTQVCLWTDQMIAGSTAMYSVVLDVTDDPTDPSHTVPGPAGNVPVSADQPPCILGSEPVAGSYVVDRNEVQSFFIDGAIDDRDVFGSIDPTVKPITFAWSVWREADQVWRDVPSYTLSTYGLDVSSFGVGEKVRVRAEALDRTLTRVPTSICPADHDDCVVPSCVSVPNDCHKWKTWDLELR